MYLTCETERPTKCCVFWKKDKKHSNGFCSFNDGACRKIIEACHQCEYVDKIGSEQENLELEISYCSVYMNPSALWKSGQCSMYFNPNEIVETKKKKMLNPIKASKKGRILV